ncbi:MAG TPA: DUF2461 domain-containing protein [Burkholderiales bacterium]|jgi:uncharacterized protein (TIGR02453 family)
MNTRELVNYLQGLAENNNRAWFVMNKPSYDILRTEFIELVAMLIAATEKFDPAVAGQDAKKALFRINRDVRFSKDKSPYKTHFSAVIAPGGKKDPGSHYYMHIDQDGKLLVAGGCYLPPPDVLAKIRRHIVAEPAVFSRLLKNKTLWTCFGDFADEGKLARPPKGYAADTPHIEHLKQKSFIVWREFPVKGMTSDKLLKQTAEGFKASLPLIKWLRQAVA